MIDFKSRIIDAGLDEEQTIAGLSESEILDLERSQNVRFPSSYRRFLADCGKGAGLFARDADFFYPKIRSLKSELQEMLDEEGIAFDIPPQAFVFGAYQGYQYFYFLCDGTDDPVVYKITDGSKHPVIDSISFEEFIAKGISDYRRAFFLQ